MGTNTVTMILNLAQEYAYYDAVILILLSRQKQYPMICTTFGRAYRAANLLHSLYPRQLQKALNEGPSFDIKAKATSHNWQYAFDRVS